MMTFLILVAIAAGPVFYFFRKTMRLDLVPALWAAAAGAAALSILVLGIVAVTSLV